MDIIRINHLSKYFAFEEHVDVKWVRDVLRLEFPNIFVLKVKGPNSNVGIGDGTLQFIPVSGSQIFLLGDNGRMGRLEVIKDEKVTFNEYTEGGFFSEGKVLDKCN